MRVLVACEESQVVCKEFRKLGHEAYGCDILPCSGGRPEWHIQGDVVPLLSEQWDMIIAFPPCTYLTVSNTYLKRGCSKYTAEEAKQLQKDGVDFFMLFTNINCSKVAIENPIRVMSTYYRKPDQVIQPWMFGEDASKQTCLWLKGLPLLKPTKIIPPKGWKEVVWGADCDDDGNCPVCKTDYATCECIGPTQEGIQYKTIKGFFFGRPENESSRAIWGNQTPTGQNKLPPTVSRAKIRATTYKG